MSRATTTSRFAMPTWTDDTTTTTAPRLTRCSRGNRTVDPIPREKAQLLGVRLAGDLRFIAWSLVPELIAGVQITSGYFLTVDVDEGVAGFAGDSFEVASPYASVLKRRFNVLVARHHGVTTARTALGKRLCELRARIVAKRERLLTWDDIDRELDARRGERNR